MIDMIGGFFLIVSGVCWIIFGFNKLKIENQKNCYQIMGIRNLGSDKRYRIKAGGTGKIIDINKETGTITTDSWLSIEEIK